MIQDSKYRAMEIGGIYEMSSTMHNNHSTWESTSNDMKLFKGSFGVWQIDQTIQNDIFNDDNGDCPSSAQWASQIRTFPVQINAQDRLFMARRYCR